MRKTSAQVRDRLVRINETLKLHKENPEWNEHRILVEMCVLSGVRETRIIEYIKLLKQSGRW